MPLNVGSFSCYAEEETQVTSSSSTFQLHVNLIKLLFMGRDAHKEHQRLHVCLRLETDSFDWDYFLRT